MSHRSRSIAAVALAVALVLGAGGCGDDELTPEEARLKRVEDRLKLSFTDEQVECMLAEFSDELIVTLDGERALPQSGAELDEFTSITRGCIIDSGDTLPGTPEDPTDTTDPAAAGSGPDETAPGSGDGSAPDGAEDAGTDGEDADGEDPDGEDADTGTDGSSPQTRPETGPDGGGGSQGESAGQDG